MMKVEGCVHHWMLDEPAGAMVKGVCKSCGEVKTFESSGYLELQGQQAWQFLTRPYLSKRDGGPYVPAQKAADVLDKFKYRLPIDHYTHKVERIVYSDDPDDSVL